MLCLQLMLRWVGSGAGRSDLPGALEQKGTAACRQILPGQAILVAPFNRLRRTLRAYRVVVAPGIIGRRLGNPTTCSSCRQDRASNEGSSGDLRSTWTRSRERERSQDRSCATALRKGADCATGDAGHPGPGPPHATQTAALSRRVSTTRSDDNDNDDEAFRAKSARRRPMPSPASRWIDYHFTTSRLISLQSTASHTHRRQSFDRSTEGRRLPAAVARFRFGLKDPPFDPPTNTRPPRSPGPSSQAP